MGALFRWKNGKRGAFNEKKAAILAAFKKQTQKKAYLSCFS